MTDELKRIPEQPGEEVAERKRMEEALLEREAQYRALFEGSPDAILLADAETGDIVDANAAASRLLARPHEEIVGLHHSNIHPPQMETFSREGFARYVEETRGRVEIYPIEHAVLRPDGSEVPVEILAQLVTIKGKKILQGVFRDITARKRVEEALRESRNLLQAVLDTIPARVFWKDRDLRYLGCNKPFALDAGVRSPDEMIGKDDYQMGWREQADLYRSDDRHVLESGKPKINYEEPQTTPDGRRIWLRTNKVPLQNADGTIQGVLGTYEDITGYKQTAESLRQAALIVENSPVMLFRWKAAEGWPIALVSQNVVQLGYTPEELLDGSVLFASIVHPEDLERIGHEVQTYTANGIDRFQQEYRIITKDGLVRWVDDRTVVERDDTGCVTHYQGIIVDITERKRAEQALRRNEERFRSIAETTTDVIYRLRPDGSVNYVSPSVQSVLGFTVEETMGKNFTQFIHPEDMENAVNAYQQLLEGKPVRNLSLRVLKKAGDAIHVEVNVIPLAHDGSVYEIQGVIHDITERKRAEEEKEQLQAQFIQAQKMESVGRLAGGVAHDFNNMLNVILGYAEIALKQLGQASPLRDNLQNIQMAAKRSADLTRQLLAFARKQTIAPRLLDLNETVEGILKLLLRLIGENISVAWVPGRGLWTVKIDPAQVDQILANLLVNARDAIADKGKITIETDNVVLDEAYCTGHRGFMPGRFAMLAVSDDGCGMDQEHLAHIFEPFFTTKGVGRGIGLGLATVYGIVKQNDGFINVYSEPGKGTTIRIYLPSYETRTEPVPAEGPAAVKGGTETILLVEDEPMVLKLCKTLLEERGFTVLTASTPGEAMRLAAEHAGRIHLLITDVVMPEMNGWDLAKRLLALYPDIKSLFMSGYTSNIISQRLVQEEGVHFMQKPFSEDELTAKVREALGR